MSIQQIAQMAGVPYSTTWRVINRSPGVSVQATEAVERAMQESGYVRPQERRPVKNGKSRRGWPRSIALLVVRNNSPFSIAMIRIVQKILNEEGLNLIFGHVAGPEDLPPAVVAGTVDGLLGYGEFPASALSNDLLKIPAVWMMSPSHDLPDRWGDRVMPDHRVIGEIAANHLLDRGHEHLAFLGGCCKSPFIHMRGESFATCAQGRAKSVHVLNTPEVAGESRSEEMERIVQMWSQLTPRPTGLFVPTDALSVWAYTHLQRRGVQVGSDVEVISCDRQQEHLSLLHPQPASIDPGRETIARLAVERLLWRMREGTGSPPVRIVVSPSLS